MNYYNPYFNNIPYMATGARTGLFSKILGGNKLNLSSILSGTQKTLNIVNQTIPIIKQASPIMKNAKTMFKVMNEFKKVDTPVNKEASIMSNVDQVSSDYIKTNHIRSNESSYEGPTFFV